jgi:opacity protein-like surface antigen
LKFSLLMACVILSSIACCPNQVWAQEDDRVRDTGRHKPAPPKVDVKAEEASKKATAESRWYIGVDAGAQGGGDMWHVETLNGLPPSAPWDAVTPFTSERFNATLDTGFAAGLFVGRKMGEMWSLKANLSSSRMDLAAEALQGQGANVFLYDRLTITSYGLAAEIRLVRLPSYPYFSVGMMVNHLSAARETDLNQNQVGAQFALGYAYRVSNDFAIKLEARYSRSSFDIGDFLPQVTSPNQPTVELDSADNINLYGLFIGVQMGL